MDNSRTEALIGSECTKILNRSSVAVFGIGGVGSYAAEAVARAGIGRIILVDFDVVKPSNSNRQLIAADSTIGRKKVNVMGERIADINSSAVVEKRDLFFCKEQTDFLIQGNVDFVIDAIDSLDAKTELILTCAENAIPIISSMGTGNKLYPEDLKLTDLYRTKYDPIAKILRRRLRDTIVRKLPVVCSEEPPRKTAVYEEDKRIPASISFVPPVSGMIMAGYAVRKLIGLE